VQTSTAIAGPAGPASSATALVNARWADGPRNRAATRRLAASSSGVDRYDVRSVTWGAGPPDAVRNRWVKSRTPVGSPPRKANVAESGSANPTTCVPPPATSSSRSIWAGSVSASSST